MKWIFPLLAAFLLAPVLLAAEPPLKELMSHLGAQMYSLDEALVLGDLKAAAAQAEAIAEHPPIQKAQRAVIAKTLGPQMKDFKGWDLKVHKTASALAQVALAGEATEARRLASQLAEGCRGCHSAFREQVSKALAP
ncbi:MAG: hypothetical protein RRB13_14065 [bacterium]|nr:hypothetical protein [bacterium]